LAIVKSKLINKLKKSYPNFYKSDLEKLVSIILNEIKNSLKRGENCEIRKFGRFSTRIQKESIRRNPKTAEKINVPSKRVIHWKMSRELFNKINKYEK
tara:strand:+ start:78 stop:371 length:294 start_codon:yes stop_codon:yes gene_type:complete